MGLVQIDIAEVTVSGEVRSVYRNDKGDLYVRFQALSGEFAVSFRGTVATKAHGLLAGDRIHCDIDITSLRSGVMLVARDFDFEEQPPALGGAPSTMDKVPAGAK